MRLLLARSPRPDVAPSSMSVVADVAVVLVVAFRRCRCRCCRCRCCCRCFSSLSLLLLLPMFVTFLLLFPAMGKLRVSHVHQKLKSAARGVQISNISKGAWGARGSLGLVGSSSQQQYPATVANNSNQQQ